MEGGGARKSKEDGGGARRATAARGEWQSERRKGGKFQWRWVSAARGVK
jgi:hypothetical protein